MTTAVYLSLRDRPRVISTDSLAWFIVLSFTLCNVFVIDHELLMGSGSLLLIAITDNSYTESLYDPNIHILHLPQC